MNVEEFRDYCISMHGVEEKMPWTEPRYSMLATFSLGGKWICILDLDKKYINVKCDPEKVQELQSHYDGAFPAWHMNKTHWVSIALESDVPDDTIRSLLREAYTLIFRRLTKAVQAEILSKVNYNSSGDS